MTARPARSFYYLFDGHPGSVVAVTDASGTVAARYRYDPSGQPKSATGTIGNPWRFASEYYDTATKLYKIGARYYDPALGRWTQRDALNQPLDSREANRYAYAGADPVNFTDPLGLSFLARAIGAVKGCIEGAVKGPELAPGVDIVRKVGRVVVRIPAPQSRGAIAAVGCIEGAAKSFL